MRGGGNTESKRADQIQLSFINVAEDARGGMEESALPGSISFDCGFVVLDQAHHRQTFCFRWLVSVGSTGTVPTHLAKSPWHLVFASPKFERWSRPSPRVVEYTRYKSRESRHFSVLHLCVHLAGLLQTSGAKWVLSTGAALSGITLLWSCCSLTHDRTDPWMGISTGFSKPNICAS